MPDRNDGQVDVVPVAEGANTRLSKPALQPFSTWTDRRLAVYSAVLVPRGPVGKLDGKILGCRELVLLHDARGHPRLSTTHRGDQHLTIGLPHLLHCHEQAIDQMGVQRVVVDREGMAAEFLAQQKLAGRQVVT